MLSIGQLQTFVDLTQKRRFRTPYMLTDLAIIRQRCKEFRRLFPNVHMYYAVKCFDDIEVLKAVDDLVHGYDIASVKEIETLLSLGVHPDRITFSNPVKSEDALRKASRMGVRKFAFQSYNELVKITKHARGSEVYVRVMMDDSRGAINFSSKFGCAPEEAVNLLVSAKQLGLKPTGLAFHVGSQATDLSAWPNAIYKSHRLFEQAEAQGLHLKLLNIGGGFPVQYSASDPEPDDIAPLINGSLAVGAKTTKYMAEPGRFLVADSSAIVASVIGVEERGERTWLYLDVGTFHAFMEVFEFHKFPYPVYSLTHLQRGLTPKSYKTYVLTGPTCDSYDTMAFKVKLPTDIALGNKLLIGMTGAYTVVYGSEFNGFKVPPRHFIHSDGGQAAV